MNLTITKIDILKLEKGIRNCVAMVQLEINECFRVTGIKLFYNPVTATYFLEYPRNPANKQKRCYFYPSNKETTNGFLNAIVNAYLNDEVKEGTEE